jgi:hypothetical protein
VSDPSAIFDLVAEAAVDAGELALIYRGRAQLAALQLRLLFLRLECALPAGRDSIAHLVELADVEGYE